MLNRREFLPLLAAPLAGAASLACRPGALAAEGRRLVRAYRDAYRRWDVAQAAANRLEDAGGSYEAVRALERVMNDCCGVAMRAENSLTAFVVKAAGRVPRTGWDYDDLPSRVDHWPAAAVVLDGVLWVASQPHNGRAGELLLSSTPVAGVVTL